MPVTSLRQIEMFIDWERVAARLLVYGGEMAGGTSFPCGSTYKPLVRVDSLAGRTTSLGLPASSVAFSEVLIAAVFKRDCGPGALGH